MNKCFSILGTIFLILFLPIGCEKDVPNYISLEIKLVDEFGVQKSVFSQSDSLIFEFYLSNYLGKEATYLRPCGEFGQYLNLYREVSEGNYVNYGRPEYYCATVAVILKIYDAETILLGRIPWTWITEHGWPEKETGNYYVGDTLSLRINSTTFDFVERIYFEIE